MTAIPQDNSDIRGMSYEAARDELIAIVSTLESGSTDLATSMSLWTRGEQLATHCSAWLDTAEAQVRSATELPAARE